MNLTPQEAAEKYTKADGRIELPADITFDWPIKEEIMAANNAKRGKKEGTYIDNMEVKDGKTYIDGVLQGNRATRRAKK